MGDAENFSWLERNGGWVLLVLGVALIVVAIVVAEHEALASVLGFSGVALAVLGVLLSRLEGAFEVSPTKVSGTLKAARKVGEREDITRDEKADLLFRLLNVRGTDQPKGPGMASPGTERIEARDKPVSEPVDQLPGKRSASRGKRSASRTTLLPPPLPEPVPFTVTGSTDQIHAVAAAFADHVVGLFRQADYEVQGQEGTLDQGFDFRAVKGGWKFYVVVKLGTRLGAADVRRALSFAQGHRDEPNAYFVLAVNAGALTDGAWKALAAMQNVNVFVVPVEGW